MTVGGLDIPRVLWLVMRQVDAYGPKTAAELRTALVRYEIPERRLEEAIELGRVRGRLTTFLEDGVTKVQITAEGSRRIERARAGHQARIAMRRREAA